MQELVSLAEHKVYWVGENFEERPLTESSVGGTGVATLQYGADPAEPFVPGSSPVVKLAEYDPYNIDPEILANIEAQLTDPREVRGGRGTYNLYDAAPNGTPLLKVLIGGVIIQIFDVWDGDVGVMVSAADALVEARHR